MIIEALKTKQEYLSHKADSNYTIKPISIKDAIDGRPYYCKDCGTTLFSRRPTSREHSFVHAKGMPHTEDICRTKESEHQTPTANVRSFNLKDFFFDMIDVIKSKFIKEHNLDNDEEPTEEDNWPIWDDDNDLTDDNQDPDNTSSDTIDVPLDIDNTPVDEDKENREYIDYLSPIKAVKHVIDCGYERYAPDIIINDTYNIRVRDLIYSVPIHDELFTNPNLLNNLNRIVEMQPVTIIHQDNRFDGKSYVLARIFHYNKEKGCYDNIYFRLFIHQEDEYWNIYNKLFTKVGKEHKFMNKYNSIFVINHWIISNTPNSFNDQYYTTYEADIYDFKKQIYAPPSYKNKKAK